MDIEIISILKTKEMYDRYSRFVKPTSVGEQTYNIITSMGEWFKHSKATEIDWKHFSAWFCMIRHAKMDKTKLSLYRGIIEKVSELPPPDETKIKPLLEGLATRDYASQIAEHALRISDGDFTTDFNSISELVEKRNTAIGKVDNIDSAIAVPSIERLEAVSGKGYKWRLPCLNESLGDLRTGDFIVLGKRPDSGGTTFIASESTFIAQQLEKDKVVLWINNEESGNKVLKRIVQSALGWPTVKVEMDLPAAMEEYTKLMGRGDKIIVFDKADVHVRDVEILLKKYNVGLVVFDQLWKVHGFERESSNEVSRQAMLFGWGREIAKTHAPVITVHQADGTAEGRKWIDMSMLYGSKTAIQGEADAIITIGRVPEEGNKRYIYVPKNKLAGGNPALRNGRFEVEIQPELARWKEF